MSAGEDLPFLSFDSVTRGLSYRSEKFYNAVSILGCMEGTILYTLTGWDGFMEGVSGLQVTNPDYTSPPGVLMRFVSFISNPGSSVSQVELIRSPDGHYRFWVCGVKIAGGVPHEYKDTEYNLADLIYTLLRIVSSWNYDTDTIDTKTQKNLISQHMETFQKDTGVRDFRPMKWTSMCALLHHVFILTSDIPRSTIRAFGWLIEYEEGDHLKVYKDRREVCQYNCSYRACLNPFFQGKKHQRSCSKHPCHLCRSGKVRDILYYVHADVQTLILKYTK
jgi:hypothetical protein